jgi:Fur family ferric uptake transcriptional regulator
MLKRRMTRQRRTILDLLRKSESHPTADEIYESVRRELPRISLGTVYRNLQTLVADGRIRSISDGGKMRYDGTLHAHDHIRCLVCGKLGDMPRHNGMNWRKNTGANDTEFKIIGYKVEFVGICPECKLKVEEEGIDRKNLRGFRVDWSALAGS